MKLYITDNGRLLCEDHLGISAKTTGRDISGQEIHEVTDDDRQWLQQRGVSCSCETCEALP